LPQAGIADHRLRGAAGLRDQRCGLLHAIGILIGDQNAGAFARKRERRRATDAACRTRDNRDLAVEPAHVPLPQRSGF